MRFESQWISSETDLVEVACDSTKWKKEIADRVPDGHPAVLVLASPVQPVLSAGRLWCSAAQLLQNQHLHIRLCWVQSLEREGQERKQQCLPLEEEMEHQEWTRQGHLLRVPQPVAPVGQVNQVAKLMSRAETRLSIHYQALQQKNQPE